MNKRSLICHSVVVLVTLISMLFSAKVKAEGSMCTSLFGDKVPRLMESERNLQVELFTKSESVLDKLEKEGVLNQIKTSGPSLDHIEFFSAQIPLIAHKLTIKFVEAEQAFKRKQPVQQGRVRLEKFQASKRSLQNNFSESYQLLLEEAAKHMESQTVTSEWYMNFFLKSIVLSDVALRITESKTIHQFEALEAKLDTVSGKAKVFSSENQEELRLYATLGKEFSILTKDAYYTRHLIENTIVPVLFVPKDADIIRAEGLGVRFVSLVGSPKETVEGKKYPLQFAARQVGQAAVQANGFRNLVNNSRSKWLKYHNKIAARVSGNPKLEALYAFILRDAGIQSELTGQFETGHRFIILFDAHRASNYLKQYLKENHETVKKIADETTIESLLSIIYAIEKEALASPSHK